MGICGLQQLSNFGPVQIVWIPLENICSDNDQCVAVASLDIPVLPAVVSSLLNPPTMKILLSMEADAMSDIALGRAGAKFH